jgi:hypothetical protein
VNLTRRAGVSRHVIVEFKTKSGNPLLFDVSSRLPMRIETVSKYVMAVESLLSP